MTEPSDPSQPAPPRDLTGRIGKYEIVRPLGKGAMGQVYLAHDTILDRDVALKVMVAQIADDPELKTRFMREAKAVAKMKTHVNLVTVFDCDYHSDGSPYIAMELLKGEDLQKRMRQTPRLTLEEKVGIIVRVLNGLSHAHKAGIVHRDIKPANIFIQDDGAVKIMDFGVMHMTGASMTGTGNVVGTADYMSPEQVQGKKVDGRSDLFSVGCLLFELVAGRRPFHSDNLMAIFYKITHEEANFDLVPKGADHDALMPILRRALDKDIDKRYQIADQFAVDLREWLKAHATTASSQSVLESLVDLDASTQPPLAATVAPGGTASPATVVPGATLDLGTGRPGTERRGRAPTRATGAGTTLRPGPTRISARPVPSRARAQAPSRAGILPWIAVLIALGAVGISGYFFWKSQQTPQPPPTTLAAAPTPTPPPPTTLATPVPTPATPAPAPTFEAARGRAAVRIRSAQTAFESESYDQAVEAAQQALKEDPGNATAQRILDNALAGQRARIRLRAAEEALARSDFAAAEQEADAARGLAAWDRGIAAFYSKLTEARARAQRDAESQKERQRATQITGYLNQATDAMTAKRYEAAIAFYDRALAIDPENAAAQTGRQGAIAAKSVAEAAASGARTGGAVRSFVAGRTQARGASPRGGSVPEGFEPSAGVDVKQGTQAAELPGQIVFEFTPESPKPGDSYRVQAFLVNEGGQPIQLTSMMVVTTIDGKAMRGPVPPAATTVAPRRRALVYQMPQAEIWREGTTSWSMEIILATARDETYRNTLTWK